MEGERSGIAKKVYKGVGIAVSVLFSMGLARELLRTQFWDVKRVNAGDFATAGLSCLLGSMVPGIAIGLTWPISLPLICLHCIQIDNPLYREGYPPDNLFQPEG